jgi:gamma-glutamylcyclotransferase (GGCT)/AIG2-like uncharacterized protein YtfP
MRLGAAIFAYGTLMSGEFNHEWALRPDAIEQARVQGKLYHMGFCPALIARGVGAASARREDDVVRSGVPAAPPEHAHVQGELFWYADDERALFALRSMDRLEGYSPEFPKQFGYTRVLLPVQVSDGTGVLAWTYIRKPDEVYPEEYLTSGSWRASKNERTAVIVDGNLYITD